MENYGGGPEISFSKNDDIYNSSSTIVAEDLFYSKIHKKATITDCDITSRDIINESNATLNYEIKREIIDNDRDYIQQTYLDYTNCNENDTINASKFDDTLHNSKEIYNNSSQ